MRENVVVVRRAGLSNPDASGEGHCGVRVMRQLGQSMGICSRGSTLSPQDAKRSRTKARAAKVNARNGRVGTAKNCKMCRMEIGGAG